jgi:hypothetical protein
MTAGLSASVGFDHSVSSAPRARSRQGTSAVAARAWRHRNPPRKRAPLEREAGHYCSIRSLRLVT